MKISKMIELLNGTHDKSTYFADAIDGLEIVLNPSTPDLIVLQNERANVTITEENGKYNIASSNLVDSKILISDEVSALSFALHRMGINVDPEDEANLKVLPTGYPVVPKPAVTFADHSYPAFSLAQMQEYARDSVTLFTGMSPFAIPAATESYDDLYKDFEVEWCETCGGQVGDDCSCNDGEYDEEEDEVCLHCNSESCQCLPDCDHCGRASCDCDVEDH